MKVIPKLVSFENDVNNNSLLIKILLVGRAKYNLPNSGEYLQYLIFSNQDEKLYFPLLDHTENEYTFQIDSIGLKKILDTGLAWRLKIGFQLENDLILVNVREAVDDVYSKNIEFINDNKNVSLFIHFDNEKALSLIATFVKSKDLRIESINRIESYDNQLTFSGSIDSKYQDDMWIVAIPVNDPENNSIEKYKIISNGTDFEASIPIKEFSFENDYAIFACTKENNSIRIIDIPLSAVLHIKNNLKIISMGNNDKNCIIVINPEELINQDIVPIIDNVIIENKHMSLIGKFVSENQIIPGQFYLERGMLIHRASVYYDYLEDIAFNEEDFSFDIKINLQNDNYFSIDGVYDFILKVNHEGITKNLKFRIDDPGKQSESFIITPMKNIFTKEHIKKIRPYKTQENTLSLLVHSVRSIFEVRKINRDQRGIIINCKINTPLEKFKVVSVELKSIQEEIKYTINEYKLHNDELNINLNYDLLDKFPVDAFTEDIEINITFQIGENTYINYLSLCDENGYFIKSYPIYSIDNQRNYVFPFFDKDNKFLLKYGKNLNIQVSKAKTDSKYLYLNIISKNNLKLDGASIVLLNKEKHVNFDIKPSTIKPLEKSENCYEIIVKLSDLIINSGSGNYKLYLKNSSNDNKEILFPLLIIDESVINQKNKTRQLMKNGTMILLSNNNKEMCIELSEEHLQPSSIKAGKVKNFLAKIMAKITPPFKKKNVWLIGENLGQIARDNGLSFFKYCYETNKPENYFYVAKKDNFDFDKLQPYKNKVIYYDSLKHYYLYHLSKHLIVSHGIRDVMPSFYHSKMRENNKDVIYLQHGIIAMKKLSFNSKSYNGRIRKFVVSSEQEKDILVNEMKFREDQIMITGLPRFDYLKSENQNNKEILLMPTWREWLLESSEEFLQSKFYKTYYQLINSKELDTLLEKNNVKINFVLHVEMLKYAQYFTTNSKNIKISSPGDVDIQRLIRTTKMLITDYSSIAFDFAYQKKPIIFYQFDLEDYLRHRGSYVDMYSELPGYSIKSEEQFITVLEQILLDDFKVDQNIELQSKRYFEFMDKDNSKRIYNEIKQLG